MNNLGLLPSSDNKIAISSPYNPVHLTHVGYNQETGEFIVSNLVIIIDNG
jgi:hypothetical protein